MQHSEFVEQVPIDWLIKNAWWEDEEDIDRDAISALAADIKKNGLKTPIELGGFGDPKITDGHHRLLALKELGHSHAPTVVVPTRDPYNNTPQSFEKPSKWDDLIPVQRLSKVSSVDNLSSEILALVASDPAAQTVVNELSPYGEVYVVGGAPRDIVLGKNPKDIDMMARVDGKTIMRVLKSVPGGTCIETGKQFPVYRFKYQGSEIEIALPRTEEKSGPGNKDWKVVSDPTIPVEEDLRRRDFTVNAIAVNAQTGEVHDPFGGIQDLEKQQLRTVTDTSFRDDSSRTLRALTQMAKNGIVPDDVTRQQMAQYAEDLNKAAPELVQMELDKIMKAGNPHLAIRLAYETGVLKQFLPEVERAFGFDQKNPYHQLDLGTHLLTALENVLHSDDPDLRLAALLHDIGKPDSQWIDEKGNGRYYRAQLEDEDGNPYFVGQQHEEVGADLARARMKALKYPNERIDNVDFIIRNHMFPTFKNLKGARKFLQMAGSYEKAMQLITFREADFNSKGNPMTAEEQGDVQRMKDLLDQVVAENNATTLKDLAINGRDLINAGFQPGPQIGTILNSLLEAVIEDPSLNTPETLLNLAKSDQTPKIAAGRAGATPSRLREVLAAKPDLRYDEGKPRAFDAFSKVIESDTLVPHGPPMPRRKEAMRDKSKLIDAVKTIMANGGGSFNPKTLESVAIPGYYVSNEGQEEQVPVEALNYHALDRYLTNKAWAWKDPSNVFGVWVDGGIVYLDVTRIFTDLDEALAFGKDNKQLAIYDSINDEVITLEPETSKVIEDDRTRDNL